MGKLFNIKKRKQKLKKITKTKQTSNVQLVSTKRAELHILSWNCFHCLRWTDLREPLYVDFYFYLGPARGVALDGFLRVLTTLRAVPLMESEVPSRRKVGVPVMPVPLDPEAVRPLRTQHR